MNKPLLFFVKYVAVSPKELHKKQLLGCYAFYFIQRHQPDSRFPWNTLSCKNGRIYPRLVKCLPRVRTCTHDIKGAKAIGLRWNKKMHFSETERARGHNIGAEKLRKGAIDRKKYWQSLDIHISHPTRPACSLFFIELHWAGGTAWQASSFNGKYGPSLASRLALCHYSCSLSIPPDIILSPVRRALSCCHHFLPPLLLALWLVF